MDNKPNERVISKIQKLFARRQSNFAAEAESALLKAQELMLQHGITMSDIETTQDNNEKTAIRQEAYHAQAPRWYGSVAGILASNFRCKHIWFWKYKDGKKIRVMTFIGLEEDAQIVKEAYMYAISLVKYNIKNIKKRYPRVTIGYINTYIDGFIAGLSNKFQEQVSQNDWGLILVTPVPVQREYDSLNPVTLKQKGAPRQTNNNENAYSKGFQDGKTFEPNIKSIKS